MFCTYQLVNSKRVPDLASAEKPEKIFIIACRDMEDIFVGTSQGILEFFRKTMVFRQIEPSHRSCDKIYFCWRAVTRPSPTILHLYYYFKLLCTSPCFFSKSVFQVYSSQSILQPYYRLLRDVCIHQNR